MKSIVLLIGLLTSAFVAQPPVTYNTEFKCVSEKSGWTFEIVSNTRPSDNFKRLFIKTTGISAPSVFFDYLTKDGENAFKTALHIFTLVDDIWQIKLRSTQEVLAECWRD